MDTPLAIGIQSMPFTAVFLLLGITNTPAQDLVLVRQQATCPSCRISLEHVLDLTDPGDSLPTGLPVSVVTDSRGWYYMYATSSPDAVLLFDDQGAGVSMLGRPGDGPGEFRRIEDVLIDEHDSLYVFDPGTLRMTVFSPASEVIRTIRVHGQPKGGEVALLPGYGFVMNAQMAGADEFRFPVHVIDRNGGVLSSFGNDSGPVRASNFFQFERAIARGHDSTVWVAHRNQYQIEHWTANGELLRTFVNRRDWFDRYDEFRVRDESNPPLPEVRALSEISPDIVMVLIWVSATDWPAGTEERFGHGVRSLGVVDFNRAYDTIIEAIDVKSGRLLASRRVDPAIAGFLNDNHVFSYREDEEGKPSTALWQVNLQR